MANKALLVLQGGGALGAYECGVYKALIPLFAARGQTLHAVAGTSIGAINASLIALSYERDDDHGVGALERFWTTELSSQPLPLLPCFDCNALNAVWTSLLFGHPRLYSPYFFGWNLLPPVFWAAFTQFYDTAPMRRTLEKHFAPEGQYSGVNPRLIVTAVDIAAGLPAVFDSGNAQAVTPTQVMACCALPPSFPEQSFGGKHYWDGGLWSNTPLREALNSLQMHGGFNESDDVYEVFIVDLFPREARLPQSNWEVWNRINQITYADKTAFDETVANVMNDYISFVKDAKKEAVTLPAGSKLKRRIERESQKVRQGKRKQLQITRIERKALPGEATSREIDFSPQRIGELIDQGFRDAQAKFG